MLYTPVPGTPLWKKHEDDGTLLDESECPTADVHGQTRFNYRHPHIVEGQEGEMVLRAFRRDFDLIHYHGIGPSLFAWLPRLGQRTVVATVHGLRDFSLPVAEIAVGALERAQVALAKLRRLHAGQWSSSATWRQSHGRRPRQRPSWRAISWGPVTPKRSTKWRECRSIARTIRRRAAMTRSSGVRLGSIRAYHFARKRD